MKTQFNGERLKKARIYRGLTVAELAEQVGCQRQTLSMYEISKSQPNNRFFTAGMKRWNRKKSMVREVGAVARCFTLRMVLI